MKINEVIKEIKASCRGVEFGKPIDPVTTRDQILFGDGENECTGITVTCFANINVINAAIANGTNLIISHESLFWNHGDHTDWLKDNTAFQKKEKALREAGITVWRFHDYIHSGISIGNGDYSDGIFYGLMREMGWQRFMIARKEKPLLYRFAPISARDLAAKIMEVGKFNGVKVIGNPDTVITKLFIAEHIMERNDNEKIVKINDEDIDAIMTLELIDWTVAEYMRDASLLGENKVILDFGHFNTEELGMRYLVTYLPTVLSEKLPVYFSAQADMYNYLSVDDQKWRKR